MLVLTITLVWLALVCLSISILLAIGAKPHDMLGFFLIVFLSPVALVGLMIIGTGVMIYSKLTGKNLR